jgi:flagellar basal-body rod modification protein FlgD
MDVGAVTTSTAQTTARNSLSGNFDTFLKLLTTQLQNQDPLEPMDATSRSTPTPTWNRSLP